MFVFLNIVYAFLGKYGRLGETLKNQNVSSQNIETLDEPLLSGNLKAKKKSTTTLDTPQETKEHEDYEKKPKQGPKSHDESNSIFYKQPKLIDRDRPSNDNMDIDGGDTLFHVENKMQKKYDSDGMAQNFSDDSSSIESTYQEYEHEPRHPNAFSDAIRSQSARKSYGNKRDTATDDNYRSKRRMRNRRKDRVRKNRSKSQTQYGKPAGIRNNDSYEIDRFDEVGINDEPLDIELSATYQAYTADRDVPENLDDLDLPNELEGNYNDGLVDKSIAQRRPKNRLGKGRATTDIIPEYKEYPTPHRRSTCAEIEDGMIPDNNGIKPKIKKIVVPGKPREVCIVKVIPIPIDKDGHPLNRPPV